ncbi:hypothetical protein HPB47_014826 [Ixodes persulcatus]|uniref:Uncharacterized protein n=1 Tax=Ixodes persulcatus TaxID=34615 RepID=A0AC60QXF5_IXOPE|nr:hypothetical protein HPB47_014826 [Ixodes persulcatus]
MSIALLKRSVDDDDGPEAHACAASSAEALKMADPVLRLVAYLILTAGLMSIIFHVTLTVLPRMAIVSGIMLCIWAIALDLWAVCPGTGVTAKTAANCGPARRPRPEPIEDFKRELERLNVLREVASIGAYQMNHVWIVTLRSSAATLSNTPDIREIIRNVVREEIKKLLPATHQPASVSIAEVVREEVQRAFQPEAPASVAAPEEPSLTYAAVARRPAPVAQQYSTPPRRVLPEPQTSRRREGQPEFVRTEHPTPRKTDVWRTADRRPLCYHCGEADHIYRSCPYRRLGLRGFHPNDPRPSSPPDPTRLDPTSRGHLVVFLGGIASDSDVPKDWCKFGPPALLHPTTSRQARLHERIATVSDNMTKSDSIPRSMGVPWHNKCYDFIRGNVYACRTTKYLKTYLFKSHVGMPIINYDYEWPPLLTHTA